MIALESFTAVGVVAIFVLTGLSAFFSSSETAIFTLPLDWIDEQATRGDASGKILKNLRQDPHRLLVTILLGNNVVNVAIASITTVLVTRYLPAGPAVSVATILASFLILIFGEIVPKSYGLGHAKQLALTVARPITVIGTVLYPLVSLFDVVTSWMNARIGGESDIEKPYVDE